MLRLPVAAQVPLAESYSSALARATRLIPPATSTLPLGSKVTVLSSRAVRKLPVAVQVPLAGPYNSRLAPATRTLPLGSTVSGSRLKPALARLRVAGQVPL